MAEKTREEPTLLVSILPVAILIAMLGYCLLFLGLDLETGGSHIPLIMGAAVASLVAAYLGYPWKRLFSLLESRV